MTLHRSVRSVLAALAVAASHLPFPGIGRLRAEGKGYVRVPLTYNPVR